MSDFSVIAVELLDTATRPVSYFGNTIAIPQAVKYIAMEADGGLYGYTAKPILKQGHARWIANLLDDYVNLGKVTQHTGDWKQSLQEV